MFLFLREREEERASDTGETSRRRDGANVNQDSKLVAGSAAEN
tara:strand:- start:347 stop:475 length:129 start_codon:yes stop_codon:yes gene_type:complete